ncbi:transient receptor potential channel pyrexia-like isoform X2 [Camponotus floridanus]|nr:transient receptor potential channel pyrexia-like isoform X2 [Camponotus floridanus]
MTPVQLLAEWPDTCLLISSWLGHVELVKALIEKGVPVSTKDNDGRTLLHLAACTASTKIVEELLKHGADPCEWDFEKKYTPLHCAAAAGCVDTVKCLIKSKADVDARRSPLYYAVLNNAVDCVETLLQAGADADNPQVYTKMPLHVAVTLGNVHCIKLLLDHNADVTIKMGPTKSTPLHLAADKGNVECTKLLLDAGARTDSKNSNGQTAMHLATLAQSVETIKELIKFGANVNAEDKEGRTPLHFAVSSARKSSELVKTLIKADASVNKADKGGYTPLHLAALNEKSQTVMMLLSKGGDVTARAKDGVTALSIIVRRTPEVLSQLATRLDRAVTLLDHEHGDIGCELLVDFRPLVPLSSRNETDLMLCLVEVGQGHRLKHPLCESFLHLKWKRIRKFFVLNLLFHLIFVAFFTGFVCATYLWDEKQLNRALFPPVLTVTCLFAIKEIFQITYGIYYYTKHWENWLQWSVIVASSIILIYPPRPWQYHVAAVGILLAWIELMIVIGYFPMFGLYVQMLTRVSINFFKFLTAYFCLIIGFSLSFNVLHGNYKAFADPLLSMLKMIVMMSGELEFEDVFFDNKLKYPGTAHVMILCFVILVTVILMNLMVGLAVSDIQEIRRTADLERLVRHAEIIGRFENMLFSKLIDDTHACKIIQACRKTTLFLRPEQCSQQCTIRIRPNDPREKCLPRELIQSLYRLAGEKKMRRGTFRGGVSPPQNLVAKESKYVRFNRTYSNVGNQQQLDDLVVELKECSYDISIRVG